MFNQSLNLAVGNPEPFRCISAGYLYYLDGFKVYVRIYDSPYTNKYNIKVRLPEHKTLHLLWGAADFQFVGNWLMFSVPRDNWVTTTLNIRNVFNSVYFD